MIGTFLLSGCSLKEKLPGTGSGSLSDLIKTASGFLIEARDQATATIELGKIGIEKGKKTVEEVKYRVDQVEKGIEKVQEGKKQVEEAIGTK